MTKIQLRSHTTIDIGPVKAATYRTRLRLLRMLTRAELNSLADAEWRPFAMDRLTLTHRLARWWDDRDMREMFKKILDKAQ